MKIYVSREEREGAKYQAPFSFAPFATSRESSAGGAG
jgi:hypothetical protein